MQLADIIIDKIQKDGPVSFRDFMEMALYHPELGYYTLSRDKIGTNGDYYTSPVLTPVFGAMIGRQIEEMWNISGGNEFTLVEYGAGTGSLSRDILDYLKCNNELYSKLRYSIVEKSPAMRERERAHLSAYQNVSWYNSIREIPEITGCILSNELVDNFSVHQVLMLDELMEVFVDYKNGFEEVLKPASSALKEYMSELGVKLPWGFRTEINLEATEWIREMAASINRGYVMTIDYGYPSEELYYQPKRRCGTLLCYNNHAINDQPYNDIGKQDITSHVNFSALSHWGSKNGLESCGLVSQADFLLSLGFKEYLKKVAGQEEDKRQSALKEDFLSRKLLLEMGGKIKVLIQRKGVPIQRLAGLGYN